MNTKDYISSGILESYVLGIASPGEKLEVERYAAQYPEIKAELTAIEESIGNFTLEMEKMPPVSVKENIFSAIRQLQKEEPVKQSKIIDLKPSTAVHESHFNWWIAAAVTLLLVSSAINLLLYNKWNSAENQLVELNSEKETLAGQLKAQKTIFDEASANMHILMKPGNKVITLKGSKIEPGAMAVVYWNNQTHDVYLNVVALPQPPEGSQYQLWAIVDGKPMDAGMLDMTDESPLHKMKSFENAQAFAITLEKNGGSPAPDLNALYVIGNV